MPLLVGVHSLMAAPVLEEPASAVPLVCLDDASFHLGSMAHRGVRPVASAVAQAIKAQQEAQLGPRTPDLWRRTMVRFCVCPCTPGSAGLRRCLESTCMPPANAWALGKGHLARSGATSPLDKARAPRHIESFWRRVCTLCIPRRRPWS